MRRFCVMLGLTLALVPQGLAESRRPVEAMALADGARAVPPEFGADILLRVAESRFAQDAAWKRELIGDAFQAAARAPLPFGAVKDTGLDRLSLESRAVRTMLTFDAPRGRALFEQIVLPELPLPSCQDALRPDVSAYYRAAGELFEKAFSDGERQKGEDVRLVENLVRTMRSPAQVVPVLKLLAVAQMTDDRRRALTAAFAGLLETLPESSRLFSADAGLLVSAAVPAMHDSDLLMPALRAYIVRQSRAPRCSDLPVRDGLPEPAAQFNRLIALTRFEPAVYEPIQPDEVKPEKDGGVYKQTGKDDFSKAADAWVEQVLQNPAGTERSAALAGAVGFFEQTYDPDRHNAWFTKVKPLFAAAREARSLDILARSNNPILALYARVESLLP